MPIFGHVLNNIYKKLAVINREAVQQLKVEQINKKVDKKGSTVLKWLQYGLLIEVWQIRMWL